MGVLIIMQSSMVQVLQIEFLGKRPAVDGDALKSQRLTYRASIVIYLFGCVVIC
jgi:hypothetical protein